MNRYRVLVHLDESNHARVTLVLNNIDNLIADLGQGNVDVELVANGGGVNALLSGSNEQAGHIAMLAARGVRFAACANSLHHLNLSPEALLAEVDVVPSGVGELVKKQTEGWSYLRP
jgi:intracellular sulfur oxidation DsrE/DsrF family protein